MDQRHIAVEDQHALGGERRQGLGHGVAGTQLLGLEDEVQVIGGQTLAHRFGTVADHHVDALRIELASGIYDVAEHGLAGHRVQYLGQSRAHARALAGGEDDDIEGHGRNHRIRLVSENRNAGKEKG
ncbi:hypothetical protein D9M70_582680 [compost metagenome]